MNAVLKGNPQTNAEANKLLSNNLAYNMENVGSIGLGTSSKQSEMLSKQLAERQNKINTIFKPRKTYTAPTTTTTMNTTTIQSGAPKSTTNTSANSTNKQTKKETNSNSPGWFSRNKGLIGGLGAGTALTAGTIALMNKDKNKDKDN